MYLIDVGGAGPNYVGAGLRGETKAMVAPSETMRGTAWVTNFDAADRAAASVLLDSVRFVPLGTVMAGLKQRLLDLQAVGEIEAPAMLVPALSLEDLIEAVAADGDTSRSQAPGARLPRQRVAFEDFLPGQSMPVMPGSEAFMGSLIRDLVRSDPDERIWMSPSADLSHLKEKRVRTIVILTDYAGSGQQLDEFAKLFTRNSTIRSWRSLKKLKIVAVAYGVSARAEARVVGPGKAICRVWSVETAPSMDVMDWTPTVRSGVQFICRHYPRPRGGNVGYANSGGLFATSVSVPNNLPTILRYESPTWNSFFTGRSVPPDLVDVLGDRPPSVSMSDVAFRAGQVRLSEQLKNVRTPETQELLAILAILARGSQTDVQLGASTRQPTSRVEALVEALMRFEFIDQGRRVTSSGREVLTVSRRAKRQSTANLHGSTGSYYPRSLR